MAAHVCPERDLPRRSLRARARASVPVRGDLVISAISVDSEAVSVQYLDKSDVRGRDGGLVVARQISVRRADYVEEVSELEEVLETFVLDVLEDWAEAPRWVPQQDDDDDDERGMGW